VSDGDVANGDERREVLAESPELETTEGDDVTEVVYVRQPPMSVAEAPRRLAVLAGIVWLGLLVAAAVVRGEDAGRQFLDGLLGALAGTAFAVVVAAAGTDAWLRRRQRVEEAAYKRRWHEQVRKPVEELIEATAAEFATVVASMSRALGTDATLPRLKARGTFDPATARVGSRTLNELVARMVPIAADAEGMRKTFFDRADEHAPDDLLLVHELVATDVAHAHAAMSVVNRLQTRLPIALQHVERITELVGWSYRGLLDNTAELHARLARLEWTIDMKQPGDTPPAPHGEALQDTRGALAHWWPYQKWAANFLQAAVGTLIPIPVIYVYLFGVRAAVLDSSLFAPRFMDLTKEVIEFEEQVASALAGSGSRTFTSK
jgi:hypothetical protein